MKIKRDHRKFLHSGFMRNIFAKSNLLTRSIIFVIGLFCLATLFFVILGYGAHLRYVGQATYFKNTVLQMANLDFSFVKNYSIGRFHEFDDIQMDIKFKHLQRIQYLRKEALKEEFITAEAKSEEFPAKMTLNGSPHDVKISLTGLLADSHLKDPAKWSFQVKVRGDDSFKGMKRFGMLRPATRGYLTDFLGFELLKERGLIGLRVDYVHLSINGKPIGIYYLEERFDKYLVENNSLREGILFKLDGALSAYQEAKLMSDPATKAQLLMVKSIWQDVMAGDLPSSNFFDMKKMAQVFAICDLMNNKHPLAGQNLRFYFNPVSGLSEPIAREWESLEKGEVSNLRLFPEKPIAFTRHAKFANDPIIKLIYDNLEFKRHYIQEVETLCQTKFLDQFLLRNKDKINPLVNKVYRFWPYYDLPVQKLYENQNYMRSALFPKDDQLTAYFKLIDSNTLKLKLHNQQYLPLEVTKVSWRDSIFFHIEIPIILDTKEKAQHQVFDFRLPESIRLPEDFRKDIKVHYNVYGLNSDSRVIGVLPTAGELNIVEQEENLIKSDSDSTFNFIEMSDNSDLISIPTGIWTISKDLIIPANRRFEIAAGARIDLVKGAGIISYSPVHFKGQEEMVVSIVSSDSSSKGICVIQADRPSQLSHVIFDKIAGPASDTKLFPGAISFFESPVTIYSCVFSNGPSEMDYLYINRSDFSLDHSLFKNIKGNALGVIYGNGSVTNSSFVDIGIDGIALISSNLTMQQLFLNNIGKQGLVVQKGSEMTLRQSDIHHTGVGITATEESAVALYDIRLNYNDIGVRIYNENSQLFDARIIAEQLEIRDTTIPYQIEEGSEIILDGVPLRMKK